MEYRYCLSYNVFNTSSICYYRGKSAITTNSLTYWLISDKSHLPWLCIFYYINVINVLMVVDTMEPTIVALCVRFQLATLQHEPRQMLSQGFNINQIFSVLCVYCFTHTNTHKHTHSYTQTRACARAPTHIARLTFDNAFLTRQFLQTFSHQQSTIYNTCWFIFLKIDAGEWLRDPTCKLVEYSLSTDTLLTSTANCSRWQGTRGRGRVCYNVDLWCVCHGWLLVRGCFSSSLCYVWARFIPSSRISDLRLPAVFSPVSATAVLV